MKLVIQDLNTLIKSHYKKAINVNVYIENIYIEEHIYL